MKLTQLFLIIILLVASFLRFYQLDQVPHGLYIDEVSIGYNAYTILTTGKDEYGVTYPLFFKAFGEYKMPVEIYLTSASIAAFGKNEFAVRFPSALFGVLSVLLLYLVVKKLFSYSVILASKARPESGFWSRLFTPPQNDELVGLLSALILAITPWHIQFSRGGFEANTALFLYLLGCWCLLRFTVKKQTLMLVFAFLSFLATIYTYNAYRVIAPATIVCASLLIYHTLPKMRKMLFMLVGGIVILLIPMLLFSFTAEGAHRFSETSAFADYSHESFLQKTVTYPVVYVKNYLSYFSLPYLFVTGDGNGRHTVGGVGQLFRWEFIFLISGLYFLLQNRKKFFSKIVIFVLLLAPTAAALTQPSPHSLRSLLLVIPLTVICAYGLVRLWEKNKMLRTAIAVIGLFAIYEFCLYFHLYYTHYPIRTAPDWGGAYKEVILQATHEQGTYDHIVVNSNIGKVDNYRNFYNPQLSYMLVGMNWEKPKEWKNEKVLYITSSEEKYNQYLQTVPHKLVQNIYLSSSHKGIFAQFWEL